MNANTALWKLCVLCLVSAIQSQSLANDNENVRTLDADMIPLSVYNGTSAVYENQIHREPLGGFDYQSQGAKIEWRDVNVRETEIDSTVTFNRVSLGVSEKEGSIIEDNTNSLGGDSFGGPGAGGLISVPEETKVENTYVDVSWEMDTALIPKTKTFVHPYFAIGIDAHSSINMSGEDTKHSPKYRKSHLPFDDSYSQMIYEARAGLALFDHSEPLDHLLAAGVCAQIEDNTWDEDWTSRKGMCLDAYKTGGTKIMVRSEVRYLEEETNDDRIFSADIEVKEESPWGFRVEFERNIDQDTKDMTAGFGAKISF